jgi:hypothetical protein
VTKIPKIRGLQRVLKRTANEASIKCGYVQTNPEGEKIMNTYTDTMKPKKEADRTIRTSLFQNPAIVTIILTLVATIAVAIFITNRPVGAAKNNPAIPYSNALEMQYARPWLESQNKPVVMFGHALDPGWIKRSAPLWSLAMHRDSLPSIAPALWKCCTPANPGLVISKAMTESPASENVTEHTHSVTFRLS